MFFFNLISYATDATNSLFATSIWVPHLLTLTTTPNFLNLKISTQLTWMPEREKRSPVPPVPLRTPPARWLAQAKYCENHKEEEAEKSRIRMAQYRASIKADPERVQEQKDRQKCADKAYREKNQNLLAFKKREKRKEANAQKGTKQGYQTEEKRDYALEYALWTHRKQYELQKKVSDALWRDKDGDPGATHIQAPSFYLVSSPAALDNRGVYTFFFFLGQP
ncbi:hypothetical protein K438DRAFT_1760830 [Mycena galopus ATCC 62051]|nr:hypothetical protein K438DRAFT_1760830 [Mycena galopus ATCC 62051]